jgi:hypothetical protein
MRSIQPGDSDGSRADIPYEDDRDGDDQQGLEAMKSLYAAPGRANGAHGGPGALKCRRDGYRARVAHATRSAGQRR